MIQTRFTEMFGLDYPVMGAPMALHSGSRLAAAVSNAGGLGAFGGINRTGPEWVREQIQATRQETGRPFAVGYITHLLPVLGPMFDVAVEERVPAIAFSFADPSPYVTRAKEAGARIICQVQSLERAREAVAAGADILVAQGNEAGGHTGSMNLLPLLVNVIEAFPDTPVLAAGGITSGRSLAAVLAAGADGAWLGTALLATEECEQISDDYKNAIVASDGEDTIYTSVFDWITSNMSGMPPWPKGIGERVRREAFLDRWHGNDRELEASLQQATEEYTAVRATGGPALLYGQGANRIDAIRPAAEVIRTTCEEAEHLLRTRPQSLIRSE
jgi:nitronate monooxygenase